MFSQTWPAGFFSLPVLLTTIRMPRSQMTEVDDTVYEVDCAMITLREGQVDIGANALVFDFRIIRLSCSDIWGFFLSWLISSAEEADEELAEGETQVNNLVHSMRLVSTQFDKKSFMTYLKVSKV